MRRALALSGVAAVALGLASFAGAQESLLPPGFDDPEPAPAPAPAPAPPPVIAPQPTVPTAPRGSTGSVSRPVVQSAPSAGGGSSSSASSSPRSAGGINLSRIPSLQELEALSTDELDELLGLKPKFDIPPAARRSMDQVGLLSASEGGVVSASLASQPAGLVKAAIEGTKGRLVSRWGHIMLRKALLSRMAAPQDMDPVEFAAMRVALLNRMGEFQAARALVQEVDTGNWDDKLTSAALFSYIATADIVGACPAVRNQGDAREDATWVMMQSICNAYAGETARAQRDINRAFDDEIAPEIDLNLAQRFAGSAGEGRQAVNIEWEGVDKLTPWRFALANALGEPLPSNLRDNAGAYYERVWATAPMVGLGLRSRGAIRGAREGILSSRATIGIFSQVYSDGAGNEAATALAAQLRDAFVAPQPSARIAAMRSLWNGETPESEDADYGRYVMTAYAAARIPASEELADDAAPLIRSMLAAGLDKDAAAWSSFVEPGSDAWAMIALGTETAQLPVPSSDIEAFYSDDYSEGERRSKFLLAGLAGLGRVAQADLAPLQETIEPGLGRETMWSRRIALAAQYRNEGLVALLAGLGMQGTSWDQMTPLHLYHIVSALNQVGMSAEARMIAAEAIARS